MGALSEKLEIGQSVTIDTSRRAFVLGGVLAATAGAAAVLQPRTDVSAMRPGENIQTVIPARVGPWSVAPDLAVVTPPEDERLAAQAYAAMITRTYSAANDATIMFVLAYAPSQSGTLIVHRPEICYPGAGFAITQDRAATVHLAPGIDPSGRFLSTRRGPRVEHVLYWTRLGDSFPRSWDGAHFDLAWQNLRGLVPDGALARMSVISADAGGALDAMNRFAAALFAASGQAGKALLAGPAHAGAIRSSLPPQRNGTAR